MKGPTVWIQYRDSWLALAKAYNPKKVTATTLNAAIPQHRVEDFTKQIELQGAEW